MDEQLRKTLRSELPVDRRNAERKDHGPQQTEFLEELNGTHSAGCLAKGHCRPGGDTYRSDFSLR